MFKDLVAKVTGLDEKIRLLEDRNKLNETKIADYQAKKEDLIAAIQKHGRVDGHYIYGINDKGERIGQRKELSSIRKAGLCLPT